jgi:periplasmic copper chaperone A
MRRTVRRRLTVLGTVVVTLVVLAPIAAAHIEPDPSRVEPGATATVAFTVEHGCDESPTVELAFKVPKTVKTKTVEPEPKDGWETNLDGRTVTFTGGPLDAETEDSFSITFTAPKKTTTLKWKIVQTCDEGTIRWIDTSHDAEHPPPAVGVGRDAPEHDDGDDH